MFFIAMRTSTSRKQKQKLMEMMSKLINNKSYRRRQSPRAELPKATKEINNDVSVNISSKDICTPADKAVNASFPPGFPQNLFFGQYHSSKAKGRPFVTQDW